MESNEFLLWGLLGTDSSGFLRRTRTLNLGPSVRRFNELAVPGMGNVWYAKQIYLSALGISVAEKVRSQKSIKNIEVANAIEALACYVSFEQNGWVSDRRLRGINNLYKTTDISFAKVKKPGFYVTQPMRMGVVQVLPSLNIVNNDDTRFNSFEITNEGQTFVNRISEKYSNTYRNLGVVDHLAGWVTGTIPESGMKGSAKLIAALSPLEKLDSGSCSMLKSIILKSGNATSSKRRAAILAWVAMPEIQETGNWNWSKKPECIDRDHWKDLEAGARFFNAREFAWKLLDELEINISRSFANKISLKQAGTNMKRELVKFQEAAQSFLKMDYDPSPEKEATKFCIECSQNAKGIERLVERDGMGLRIKGEMIVPGSAFKGDFLNNKANSENDESSVLESTLIKLPRHISNRVLNMFYLNQDLKGGLNKWLH